MNIGLEELCCSVKSGEKLKQLGIIQDSLFYWTHSDWGIMPISSIDFKGNPTSVFIAGEIIGMYPEVLSGIEYSQRKKQFFTGYVGNLVYYDSFADACAVMLINAIEEKYIDIEKINKDLTSRK